MRGSEGLRLRCSGGEELISAEGVEGDWTPWTFTKSNTPLVSVFTRSQGSLQIFSTMHEKMQISLKWLKYRLKIIISSFKYYFHTVTMVSKLKKYKKIH